MNHSLKFAEALAYAAAKHMHQRRLGPEAEPFINHPIALVHVLTAEGFVYSPDVIQAALLHDVLEDTDTSFEELQDAFGRKVASIVLEVSDDKRLPKAERKRLQIVNAPYLSRDAALVKLADKICNVRDMVDATPVGWSVARQCEYFDWALAVVRRLPSVNLHLERAFYQAYARRPRLVEAPAEDTLEML